VRETVFVDYKKEWIFSLTHITHAMFLYVKQNEEKRCPLLLRPLGLTMLSQICSYPSLVFNGERTSYISVIASARTVLLIWIKGWIKGQLLWTNGTALLIMIKGRLLKLLIVLIEPVSYKALL
jgi:hypothetical protein